ncbi:MAG: CDP-alcohol phosphatidyltransferase family protein [Candidatus Brocadiia bacterium]
MTVPNVLTICRLFLAPVFIAFFVINRPWAAIVALVVAVLFEITDLLDGYIARHFDQVSSLGKLIDPLADSVARFSVFLAFVTEESVAGDPWPVLLVAFIFYRDAIVAYMRTFAASTGVVMAARFSGKLKAVVQGIGIFTFLTVRTVSFYHEPLRQYRPVVFYCVMIPIVLVTVGSAFDYVLSNRSAIVQMARRDEEE